MSISGENRRSITGHHRTTGGPLHLPYLGQQLTYRLFELAVLASRSGQRQLQLLASQVANLTISSGGLLGQIIQHRMRAELRLHQRVKLVQSSVHGGVHLGVDPASGSSRLAHHPGDHIPSHTTPASITTAPSLYYAAVTAYILPNRDNAR